ncbi:MULTISPECIES: class I SAM-dependent methyltransferase [Rhodoplanes]
MSGAGTTSRDRASRRVLNAGCGMRSARGKLHALFAPAGWDETRLDIAPETQPDVIASITDMSAGCASASYDAVWSSHTLEHLYAHQVPQALAEFRRVLKPDGFALITSPDIETVAALVVAHGLDHVVYTSPAGPITVSDMIFGHGRSITRGSVHMAHNTGFTCDRLGTLLLDSGFPAVLVARGRYDLWALAFMERADQEAIRADLRAVGFDLFDDEAEAS